MLQVIHPYSHKKYFILRNLGGIVYFRVPEDIVSVGGEIRQAIQMSNGNEKYTWI